MSKVTDIVTDLAAPIAEKLGLEIWDVEYIREAGTWFLRVYLDKEGGIGIADCEDFSRALDPLLDETDPIPDSYVFEVSSAGAERELKKPEHFARYMGANVEVRLYQPIQGSKGWIGTLTEYDQGRVTIETAGKAMSFEKSQVAQVRLRIVF